MSNKSTQFQKTPDGQKTALMLRVEQRIGRTLEEDYREFYRPYERGRGRKALANRWRVSRQLIFGPLAPGRRSWCEMLKLPAGNGTIPKQQSHRSSIACEICAADDVALEKAHWIARCDGGSTRAENILKLCPNCHTRLDQGDPVSVKRGREVLLLRAADTWLQSTTARDEAMQRQFLALCSSIIERRLIDTERTEPRLRNATDDTSVGLAQTSLSD